MMKQNFGFDDDWLSGAVKGWHPIVNWLIGYTPEFTSELLLDFARKLKTFEVVEGFDNMLSRIQKTEEYDGAIGEFELASRIIIKGYKIELGPEVNKRRADLKVQEPSGPLYFEVKSLKEPEDEATSKEIQRWGYSLAGSLGVNIFGKVYKKLSEPHKKELKTKIEAAARDVKQSGTPKEVIEDRVMTVILTPSGYDTNNSYLQEWLMSKRLSAVAFLGPDFGSTQNDYYRLRRKFGEDQSQLPLNYRGIKVVYAPVMSIPGLNNSLSEIADPFEEEIYSQPNLLAGGLVYSYYLLGEPAPPYEVVTELNYVLLKQTFFNQIYENTLLVKNRYSQFESHAELEKFFRKPYPFTVLRL